MTGHDRDRQMDAHLRRAFADGAGESSADCLDAEALAAWLDGGLDPSAAAKAEAHVSSCARCQAMVAVMAQTTPAETPAASWWRGWMGWFVPLAATAAAVGVWMVVPNPPRPTAPIASEMQAKADTASSALKEEARVAQAPAESAPAAAAAAEPAPPAAAPARNRAQARDESLKDQAAPAAGEQKLAASNESALEKRENAERPAVTAEFAAPAPQAAPPPAAPAPQALGRALRQAPNAWEQRAVAQGLQVTALSSPSPEVCWAVGREGAVYLATGGAAFHRVSFPEKVDLARVEAKDATTAAVTSVDGRVFRTTDGGQTWR